jgi:hypothetical protein
MPDQRDFDFELNATAAPNHTRPRNAPPQPDQNGFFDFVGVRKICGRRRCTAESDSSELFATVKFGKSEVKLTATAEGKWDPVNILSACTQAHDKAPFEVEYDRIVPRNPYGLDELRIARVIGAAGVRPYRYGRVRRVLDIIIGREFEILGYYK